MHPATLIVALVPGLLAPSAATARAPAALTVPVTIQVARCSAREGAPQARRARSGATHESERPVRPASWVNAHLAGAGKVFAPHRLKLAARQLGFTPERCRLVTRADRDELAAHLDLAPGAGIHVLVVEEAADLHLAGYKLMGVHWRYRGADPRYRGRRYVILTARAKPPVLAHELSHYLGLPHDPAGGNLMTPGPSAPIWRQPGRKPEPFAPLLTDDQARRLRRAIRALPR